MSRTQKHVSWLSVLPSDARMLVYNYGAFMLSEEIYKAECEEAKTLITRLEKSKIDVDPVDQYLICSTRLEKLRAQLIDFQRYFLSIYRHLEDVVPPRKGRCG